MNRMFTSMLFTALMATGCAQDPAVCANGPTRKTMEGSNGTGTSNGLSAETFQHTSAALAVLMDGALFTDEESKTLTPSVADFVANEEGAKVLGYAIRCALSEEVKFTHECTTYQGGGILKTTDQWTTTALDQHAKEDLYTCIITHLNPLGITVPLFLSGPSVKITTTNVEYPVQEALWTTSLDSGRPEYDVWPLFQLKEPCLVDPAEALKKRVCGQNAEKCKLTPHDNYVDDCIIDVPDDGGHYKCNGRPAIKTFLKSEKSLETLYPACFPPPPV